MSTNTYKEIYELDNIAGSLLVSNDTFLVIHPEINYAEEIEYITYNITLDNLQNNIFTYCKNNLGVLALSNKIISSDIIDKLDVNQINGLGVLALSNKIISSDIDGFLPTSKIEGFKRLGTKDTIISSDIDGFLPTSKIEGLNSTIEKINFDINQRVRSIDIDTNYTEDDGELLATIKINDKPTQIFSNFSKSGLANIGIGTILPFAGNVSIPSNTLLCDGSLIDIDKFEALYTVIGTTYNKPGDEVYSNKFRLPDLVEKFIEGGKESGKYIDPGLPNISGSFGSVLGSGSGAFYNNGSGHRIHASSSTGTNISFSASRSNQIYGKSTTVQPASLMLKYVIVYKQLEDGEAIINATNYSAVANGNVLLLTEHNINTKQKTFSYTVKNDSIISLLPTAGDWGNATSIIVKINGQPITRFRDVSDSHDASKTAVVLPAVKKGSVITLEPNESKYTIADVTLTLQIREFEIIGGNKIVNQEQSQSYVIETGRFNSSDGTTRTDNSENDSWYRLYSDGWCEMGGLSPTVDNNGITIKLKKSMTLGYNVIISNAEQTYNYVRYTSNYTNNSFDINKATSDGTDIQQYWEAKGFIN